MRFSRPHFANLCLIALCKLRVCFLCPQACPGDSCNKKVVDQGDGTFRCEKCQQSYPNFQYRLILRVSRCAVLHQNVCKFAMEDSLPHRIRQGLPPGVNVQMSVAGEHGGRD